MEEWTIGTFWGQVQFYLFFFPIAALWKSLKWNIIQQIKKTSGLTPTKIFRSVMEKIKNIYW